MRLVDRTTLLEVRITASLLVALAIHLVGGHHTVGSIRAIALLHPVARTGVLLGALGVRFRTAAGEPEQLVARIDRGVDLEDAIADVRGEVLHMQGQHRADLRRMNRIALDEVHQLVIRLGADLAHLGLVLAADTQQHRFGLRQEVLDDLRQSLLNLFLGADAQHAILHPQEVRLPGREVREHLVAVHELDEPLGADRDLVLRILAEEPPFEHRLRCTSNDLERLMPLRAQHRELHEERLGRLHLRLVVDETETALLELLEHGAHDAAVGVSDRPEVLPVDQEVALATGDGGTVARTIPADDGVLDAFRRSCLGHAEVADRHLRHGGRLGRHVDVGRETLGSVVVVRHVMNLSTAVFQANKNGRIVTYLLCPLYTILDLLSSGCFILNLEGFRALLVYSGRYQIYRLFDERVH